MWASEGFEKLAGIDAIDVVGQEVGSLFEVGGTEGGEEGEEAGELKRSLELGQASFIGQSLDNDGAVKWQTKITTVFRPPFYHFFPSLFRIYGATLTPCVPLLPPIFLSAYGGSLPLRFPPSPPIFPPTSLHALVSRQPT